MAGTQSLTPGELQGLSEFYQNYADQLKAEANEAAKELQEHTKFLTHEWEGSTAAAMFVISRSMREHQRGFINYLEEMADTLGNVARGLAEDEAEAQRKARQTLGGYLRCAGVI